MILENQLTYLRDKYIATSWSNSGLETNMNLVPALLTSRFPAKTSFEIMGDVVAMPNDIDLFDVYTLGYVPTTVFREGYQYVDAWVRLDDFCSHCNTLVYLCFGYSIRSVRYSDTYVCYTSAGVLLFATKFDVGLKIYRESLVINIRSSNDSLNVDIDVHEYVLKTDEDISKVLTEYHKHPNKEQLTFVINGVYYNEPTVKNLPLDSTCCIIKDDSQLEVSLIKIPELESYTSNDIQYYLVPVANNKNGPEIYSYRDASIWLMIGDRGKRLAFEERDSVMQITNNQIAISADYLEAVSAGMLWALDNMSLKINMRIGKPQPTYVNNDNYWRVLNSLDKNLRSQVLVGELNAPVELTADWQQRSPYCKLLDTTYGELTKEALDKAYCVSTWDYYLNRPIVEALTYGNDITNIPTSINQQRALVSYRDGYVDALLPEHVDDTNNALRIGYSKAFTVNNDHLVPVGDIAAPASFDVTHPETPRLLRLGVDYIMIGNSFRINDSIGAVDTIDLATTAMYNETYTRRVLRIEGHNPNYANLTIIYDNTTLVPYVDYLVIDHMVVFWGWQLPDSAEVTLIYQPTITPFGDCLEYGFIYNNRISISGNYLAFDPSNYYIIYDGRVILPSEIDWENPFITSQGNFKNGYPFAVMQTLLSNTDEPEVMFDRRTEYLDVLDAISDFKDAHIPFPKPNYSTYEYRYKLVSVFFREVINSLVNGSIDYRPSTVASFGLKVLLKEELKIIDAGMDAITHDLDWNIIEYRGHSDKEPMAISGDMYLFLEKVNRAYLKNRIQMNQNFRIID